MIAETYIPEVTQKNRIIRQTSNEIRVLSLGFVPETIEIGRDNKTIIFKFTYAINETSKLYYSTETPNIKIFSGKYTNKIIKIEVESVSVDTIDAPIEQVISVLQNVRAVQASRSTKKNYDIIYGFLSSEKEIIINDLRKKSQGAP